MEEMQELLTWKLGRSIAPFHVILAYTWILQTSSSICGMLVPSMRCLQCVSGDCHDARVCSSCPVQPCL